MTQPATHRRGKPTLNADAHKTHGPNQQGRSASDLYDDLKGVRFTHRS
jgi:hypothetical protein